MPVIRYVMSTAIMDELESCLIEVLNGRSHSEVMGMTGMSEARARQIIAVRDVAKQRYDARQAALGRLRQPQQDGAEPLHSAAEALRRPGRYGITGRPGYDVGRDISARQVTGRKYDVFARKG